MKRWVCPEGVEDENGALLFQRLTTDLTIVFQPFNLVSAEHLNL